MRQQIFLFCWVIFLLYWLISAGSVKATQETRGWFGGNWYTILLGIGFLCIGDFKFLARLGIPVRLLAIPLTPVSGISKAVSAILLVAGLLVAILARRTLAAHWSAAVALKKDHQLITIGLYRYVRHPIYTGILVMVLGTVLSFGTLGAWFGFFVILLALLLKLTQEEALLSEHFSQEYLAYKSHTKPLIPFIW